MVSWDILQNFALALALGGIIGLEREYARNKARGNTYAGIRTYPLIALFGALGAYLGSIISLWILLASVLLMGALVIVAYFVISGTSKHHQGATSEMAGFITFFVGVLAFQGEYTLATLITITMTIILFSRSALHGFAQKMKVSELGDTLKFLVVAFVVLPFLPNEGFGPLGIFNPYLTWLMVVFISGISFGGYFLLKWFGERGIALAGILGGLVSSTAVTSSFAERSRREQKIYRSLVLGVVLANGIMFGRVLIEVLVINKALLPLVAIPILILSLLTAGFVYFIWKNSSKIKGKVELDSPFTIVPALKFAVIFAAVLALVKIADVYLNSKGVYVVSIISGIADVDAITVSLSQLAGGSISFETARDGIIMAMLTNVAVKGGIAYWLGGKAFRKIIAGFFAVLIVVGALILYLL